jgi:hypothetical protein
MESMEPLKILSLNRKIYRREWLKSLWNLLILKLFKTKTSTKQFLHFKNLSLQHGSDVLKAAILKEEPFAAVRIGSVEMGALHNYEKILLGFKKTYQPNVVISMKQHAGFFPTIDKQLTFYAKHFVKEAKKTDILGISGIHMESYMYQRYFVGANVIPYEAFEPLRGDWIQALKGKRVLVVSPFADDIRQQYAKRKLIFPSGVLPDFTLITVKAVQTIADATDDRYPTWFDALDAMKVDVMKQDFDVALVGAGAYGSHLCWFVKTMGRQAIQTGGATQTMFGIIGHRWEQQVHVAHYVNDAWIRPSEKPIGAENIEDGAFW